MPSRAKERAAKAYLASLGDGPATAALAAPAEPYALPPAIAAADLASLEALADEILLSSPELGELTVVKAYSDVDRNEITFRDLSTLRTLVQTLPGARVLAIHKPQGSIEFPLPTERTIVSVGPPVPGMVEVPGEFRSRFGAPTTTAAPHTAPVTPPLGGTTGAAPLGSTCWGCMLVPVEQEGDLCEACS